MTFFDGLLSASADLALKALLAASGLASMAGTYQPKEPDNLQRAAEKRIAARNLRNKSSRSFCEKRF